MGYNYLIYYIRVNASNVVGQGNRVITLDHKLNKGDIYELYKTLDGETKDHCNINVQGSKSIIVNVMQLDS